MRKAVVFAAPSGFGQALPSLICEFLGRENLAILSLSSNLPASRGLPPRAGWDLSRAASVDARLRLDVLDVVRHRVVVHRAVVDSDGLGRVVDPGQGVLHPVDVVALGIVLAGMGAAAFLAVGR